MRKAADADEDEGQEDVFLDASEGTGASPDLPPLRRSNRKRKSEADSIPQTQTHTGKRHRPLGNRSMERTPQSAQQSKGPNARNKPSANQNPSPGPTLVDLVDLEAGRPAGNQDMSKFMLSMRQMMREELRRTEDTITERIDGLETTVGGLKSGLRELEGRMDNFDSRLEERVDELVASRMNEMGQRPGASVNDSGTTTFTELPSARDRRYWKARRSLRMWPIKGDGAEMKTEVLKFLAIKLRLGEDVIADAENSHIVRVPAGSNNNNKSTIKHEAVVEFPTVDLRDLVRRSAFNLAGDRTAGIRLDVPHHLMKNFKALEAASYKLKQKYKGMRRNIKFDDELCDLVLEFRLHDSAPWKRLLPQQARDFQRSEGEAEEVSAADITSLLGSGNAGGEEDGEESEET